MERHVRRTPKYPVINGQFRAVFTYPVCSFWAMLATQIVWLAEQVVTVWCNPLSLPMLGVAQELW